MNNIDLLFERAITKNFLGKKSFNQVLLESDNFVVIPSLGSLVEGWLLIVPKTYALSMGQLTSELLEELEEVIQNTLSLLRTEYGNAVAFEHGAAINNTVVGCGVDYAHVHVVPIKVDLIERLEERLNVKYRWDKVSNLEIATMYAKQNLPYLYVRTCEDEHFISSPDFIPSQLFRRVIADYVNKPEEFDWKLFPCMNNIEKTIERLSKKHSMSHIIAS